MRTKPTLDFSTIQEVVASQLGFDIRDCGKHFYPETGKFADWHKKKRYPKKDPDGKAPNCSQIWFKEYMDEVQNGTWLDTPYLDFWHFQLDNCIDDVENFKNDSINRLYVGKPFKHWQPWQCTIQEKWNELFGSSADDDGYIDVWFSW